MKQCTNQSCIAAKNRIAFSDSDTTCPFCGSRLVDQSGSGAGNNPRGGNNGGNTRGQAAAPGNRGNTHGRAVTPGNMFTRQMNQPRGQAVAFEQRKFGRKIACTGVVSEITCYETFYDHKHKLINTILHGEPYQLAHQTLECVLRLENITASQQMPAQIMDFSLYGEYRGRLAAGDILKIQAINGKNKRIVKKIFNITTNTRVKPGFQLPAAMVRIPGYLILASLLFFVMAALFGSFSDVLGVYAAIFGCVLFLIGILGLVIFFAVADSLGKPEGK